jgi:hypothetical protein
MNDTQICFRSRPASNSDIEIAQAQTPKRIVDLAAEIGLQPDELESYGKYKAKVELSVLDRLAHRKDGKYIVVSGYVLHSSSGFFFNHALSPPDYTLVN